MQQVSKVRKQLVLGLIIGLILSSQSFAGHHGSGKPGANPNQRGPQNPPVQLPNAPTATSAECMANGTAISVDDQGAINLKKTLANGAMTRAHIQGTVTRSFGIQNGHNHFEISIGPNPTDTVEVIYNVEFGAMPEATPGEAIEACGDFINSYAPNNGYQASPSGAIIHWVHMSDSATHASGFVIMNHQDVYGYAPIPGALHGGPRN